MCLSAPPLAPARDLCLKPSVRLGEKQTNKQTKVALGVDFLPESEIRPLPAQADPSLTLDIHKKHIAASSYEIPSFSSSWSKEIEFCIIANHRGFVRSEVTHRIPWSFLRCFFRLADLLSPSTPQEGMCPEEKYLREELCAMSTEADPEICWVVDLPFFTTGSHRMLWDCQIIF